ncbi:MAG: UDP-N-acetylmuramate dehydrogenase [Xanthomonadaceae bacterium]|jgi:UDP-N-acetylmuramate dehydrogenase|nr:UDP-N-acetylmuramate dehydrogenase [Xanthomonadaceae bacterium]
MNQGFRTQRDAPLRGRNTFGVTAHAPLWIEVTTPEALAGVLTWPEVRDEPFLVIGGGSNILFAGDPQGAVISLRARDIRIVEQSDQHAVVRADAGVRWHDLVQWTLRQGLNGLENLVLIPGTAGAAPIQNIGAYGTEAGEFVHAVESMDPATGRVRRFRQAECDFAYRDSRFKREAGRHLIVALELRLSWRPRLRLNYAGIAQALEAAGIDSPSAQDVADAIAGIRRAKLPDPERLGNAGSFFKNPIVPTAVAEALQERFPDLPVFAANRPEQRKLSAAWLIDACGWKGHRTGDAGIADSHALVLVNHGQASGAELLDLARRVADSVQQRFDVMLEPELRVIGAVW